MAKIPAVFAAPMKLIAKAKINDLDTGSIQTASILLLLGVVEIYLTYCYGKKISLSFLNYNGTLSDAMWVLKMSGFLCAFTAVFGLVTAKMKKMIDAQLILGLVQLFVLDCCIVLHWGAALTGGILPYAAAVMFVGAVDHRRGVEEEANGAAKRDNKVYAGCVLLLILVVPLGFMLSNLLAVNAHGFFVQKVMVTFGMILYVYTAAAAAVGFYVGDRIETRPIFKLLVGIHVALFLMALLAAYALYSSLDQSGILICVGLLAIGIGMNLFGVLKWT